MDDKQQNFYKRLLINIRVKCLKQGIKNICLKQGQGLRGRAAPPHPGIYRVPPGSQDKSRFHGITKFFLAIHLFELTKVFFSDCMHKAKGEIEKFPFS